MVGDRTSDVEAGHRAGMKSAYLSADLHWAEDFAAPEVTHSNLLDVARAILCHDSTFAEHSTTT
jgi:phosphoglycolate phosphatase-like HAD superfamily hydrolase